MDTIRKIIGYPLIFVGLILAILMVILVLAIIAISCLFIIPPALVFLIGSILLPDTKVSDKAENIALQDLNN